MRIKTFNPSFEYWSLNETEAQQLTDHLTATLGNAWTLEPADVINDELRHFLFKIKEPFEVMCGEGYLPEKITGENGFFEDGEALTLEPEPAPEPAGPSVDFYENEGLYFEYTDTDGITYTGQIYNNLPPAFPCIDWDTAPDNWEQAEKFILKNYPRPGFHSIPVSLLPKRPQ